MWAWEMSSDDGVVRRERRDFDDFDELEGDEAAPEEESELEVRYLEDEDDVDDSGTAEEDAEEEVEFEEERLRWPVAAG